MEKSTAMPTKLVYTSPQHFGTGKALDVLSPKELDKLMEKEGFAIIARKDVKVPHPKTGKQVTVEQLELSTESSSRSLATTEPEKPKRGVINYADEDGGIGHGIIASRPDNGSYLGSGGDFADLIAATGPSVGRAISGEVAFGMGVDAAKMGKLASDCLMRPGTLPHREWMKGFAAGGGDMPVPADPAAIAEAKAYGKTAAKGPKDLEVTCPYPEGTDLFDAWLDSYKAHGGRVE
jgi:hypothetical protein